MGSSMKDDPVYVPSDCFETFPMPSIWYEQTNIRHVGTSAIKDVLADVGQKFYEDRSRAMQASGIGMTGLYNLVHNPLCVDGPIVQIRSAQQEMDKAVADAYGWNDLHLEHGFVFDYIEEEEALGEAAANLSDLKDEYFFGQAETAQALIASAGNSKAGSRRKIPWRFTLSRRCRDNIIERLLRVCAQNAGNPVFAKGHEKDIQVTRQHNSSSMQANLF